MTRVVAVGRWEAHKHWETRRATCRLDEGCGSQGPPQGLSSERRDGLSRSGMEAPRREQLAQKRQNAFLDT